MKKLSMWTLSALLVSLYTPATAGDREKAEFFYLSHNCQSCHGMYGEGVSAPRLQGVKKERLYERLKNLQAGKTRTANGSVMISFAQSMDENMTKIMATYLSTLKTPEHIEYYEQDPNEDGAS